MGTRAIYQFQDDDGDECFVYKHYDNYPQLAVHFIEEAKSMAWPFPRYEADEFAAAFVAANKNRAGGEVRLVSHHLRGEDEILKEHHWCDYHYEIHFDKDDQDLWVEIWQANYNKDGSTTWESIWEGTHTDMMEEYGK